MMYEVSCNPSEYICFAVAYTSCVGYIGLTNQQVSIVLYVKVVIDVDRYIY